MSTKVLIDTEYISIKRSTRGVIFRVAYLVFDSHKREILEEYDFWINYNLYAMYPNKNRWIQQLKWLNKNPKYTQGRTLNFYSTYDGISITKAKRILAALISKYEVQYLYCKGCSPTDSLLSELPLINIAAPKFEGAHAPLDELYFFKNFI